LCDGEQVAIFASFLYPVFPRAAVSMEIHMGIGWVWELYGLVGVLWGFLKGCEIRRKCVKHAINVVVDV